MYARRNLTLKHIYNVLIQGLKVTGVKNSNRKKPIELQIWTAIEKNNWASNLSISFRFDCILDYIMEISSIARGNQSSKIEKYYDISKQEDTCMSN